MTVYNQRRAKAIRNEYKDAKHLPKDLRPKKTRAIRQRLTVEQSTMPKPSRPGTKCKKRIPRVVSKVMKRQLHFPMRKFALKAAP